MHIIAVLYTHIYVYICMCVYVYSCIWILICKSLYNPLFLLIRYMRLSNNPIFATILLLLFFLVEVVWSTALFQVRNVFDVFVSFLLTLMWHVSSFGNSDFEKDQCSRLPKMGLDLLPVDSKLLPHVAISMIHANFFSVPECMGGGRKMNNTRHRQYCLLIIGFLRHSLQTHTHSFSKWSEWEI